MRKIILGLTLVPSVSFAASDLNTLLVEDFMNILDPLIVVLIGVAVVLFLYGIIKYVSSGDDEAKRKEAKNYIVYGIVVLFVMVSVWGLVNLLAGTFSGGTEHINKSPKLLPWK